jgi:serine/threonine-protein kinase HipA
MRLATIYYNQILAGELVETDDGEYRFTYDSLYVNQYPLQFITFTMPIRQQTYVSNRLFPVFEGLIPEGWLLDIATKSWKIKSNDRMGLLLACCKNCIGALSVVEKEVSDEN